VKFKIPIFIAILITYATNAQAIDQEQAKNQFSVNTQYAETQLSDIYNVIRYKSKKLQLEKESFNVRKKISNTTDHNVLTNLYCIDLRRIKQQRIDIEIENDPIGSKNDEILDFEKNNLQELITSCRSNNVLKYHIKENRIFETYLRWYPQMIKNQEDELSRYNELKNSFEEVIITRKRLINEEDQVARYNLICQNYRQNFKDLQNNFSKWNTPSTVKKSRDFSGLENNLRDVVVKLDHYCR
jgi:hypothetical protein